MAEIHVDDVEREEQCLFKLNPKHIQVEIRRRGRSENSPQLGAVWCHGNTLLRNSENIHVDLHPAGLTIEERNTENTPSCKISENALPMVGRIERQIKRPTKGSTLI